MKSRIAIAIVLAMTAVLAAAEPTGLSKLYKMKHDQAVAKADVAHRTALVAAKKVYIVDLTSAIKRALTADKTDEAVEMAQIKKRLRAEIADLTNAKDQTSMVKVEHTGKWVPFAKGEQLWRGSRATVYKFVPAALKKKMLWQPRSINTSTKTRGFSSTTSVSMLVAEIHAPTIGQRMIGDGWKQEPIASFQLTTALTRYFVYTKPFDGKPIKASVQPGIFLLVDAPKEK